MYCLPPHVKNDAFALGKSFFIPIASIFDDHAFVYRDTESFIELHRSSVGKELLEKWQSRCKAAKISDWRLALARGVKAA